MAGSYEHCLVSDDEGETHREPHEFDHENFTSMIENLGDAHEACEHMFNMIQILANKNCRLINAVSHEASRLER